MEKLVKFAVLFGISIAAVFLVLILSTILPHVIENSERDWKRAMGGNLSEEQLETMFYGDPAYSVFKAKYPDSIENLEFWNKGEGRLEVTAFNYTNLNEIRLDINYDDYREKLRIHVNCQVQIPGSDRDMHRGVEGAAASDFIEKMDCLNIVLESQIKDVAYNEFSGSPHIVRID